MLVTFPPRLWLVDAGVGVGVGLMECYMNISSGGRCQDNSGSLSLSFNSPCEFPAVTSNIGIGHESCPSQSSTAIPRLTRLSVK